MEPFLEWLQGTVLSAVVGVPVSWAATDLGERARRWFRRLRRSDGLGRIVRAAAGDSVVLSDAEFAAVRRLLEQDSTWREVGSGPVEELARRIASCLTGHSGDASLAAGWAITKGLLEFVVSDLEPEWFKKVLFARLNRWETSQRTAFDEAMLGLHADLAAQLAVKDAADTHRFERVMGQLMEVLGRLPPGQADRGEVAVYLATLVRWLNINPWAQDMPFADPVLIPAVIERKLRIASHDGQGTPYMDADNLAQRCTRLVILGGPGSGKTWLARRTARLCAETALKRLKDGEELDEVELPLYTTCARLLAEPLSGGIRHAIVASALGLLPDVGGSRVFEALRRLFEDRSAPTLLVADSLDEARGADERIRQADWLPTRWRIMLTTRPASWNRQFAMGDDDPSRYVGILQPLSYPDDVEAVITAWFGGRSSWAESLASQVRDRRVLRQAATVPLILAFFCIVGADQRLPDRRAQLYETVIRRMLTGRWRGGVDADLDMEACLETLRGWAWSAARKTVSGLGDWEDEFHSLPQIMLRRVDREALDHIAVPLGPPDDDTRETPRRFIHRFIQEQLVAEHVALHMSADQAAVQLIDHLWYDPDWEYAAPAALARHPQRDQVLRTLIRRVTGADQVRSDLAAIDGCWEIRRFLARLAQESTQPDWTPEAAEVIEEAIIDLVTVGELDYLYEISAAWPRSRALIVHALLQLLAQQTRPNSATFAASALARLDTTVQERAHARQILLGLASGPDSAQGAYLLAAPLAGLAVTAEERAQTREILLRLLAERFWQGNEQCAIANALAGIGPSGPERAQVREILLSRLRDAQYAVAPGLPASLAGLALTAEERAQALEAFLIHMARRGDMGYDVTRAFSELAVTTNERTRAQRVVLGLLAAETFDWKALQLARTLSALDPTVRDQAKARGALLRLLASETYPSACGIAVGLADLHPTSQERARAREILLGLLADQASGPKARGPAKLDARWLADAYSEQQLPEALARLAVTADERAHVLAVLLGLLADKTAGPQTELLVAALARLAATADQRAQARQALLSLLTGAVLSRAATRSTARALVQLAVTAQEKAQARDVLLGLLSNGTEYPDVLNLDIIQLWDLTYGVVSITNDLALLSIKPRERAQARIILLKLMAREASFWKGRIRARVDIIGNQFYQAATYRAERLAASVIGMGPTMLDTEKARDVLLTLLAVATWPDEIRELAEAAARLGDTAEERAQLKAALLGILAREREPVTAKAAATAVIGLEPTPQERAQVRQALLDLIDDPHSEQILAEEAATLAVTAEERAQVRAVMLDRLVRTDNRFDGQVLAQVVARLAVTVEERAQLRAVLLDLLVRTNHHSLAIASAVAGLDMTEEEAAPARQVLLRRLSRADGPMAKEAHYAGEETHDALALLKPTAADLRDLHSWVVQPRSTLLAAVRENSDLSVWLATLPLVAGLPVDTLWKYLRSKPITGRSVRDHNEKS
jgi:hypothetical protein